MGMYPVGYPKGERNIGDTSAEYSANIKIGARSDVITEQICMPCRGYEELTRSARDRLWASTSWDNNCDQFRCGKEWYMSGCADTPVPFA